MRIDYAPTIQPTLRAEIEQHIEKYLWLFPKWVLVLNVNLWDAVADECGELASVVLHYDYRMVTISFTTAWFDRPEIVKEQAVIHEILHSYFGILADYARSNFDLLCDKNETPKFNQSLQNELAMRHESATQDLAFTIYELTNR